MSNLTPIQETKHQELLELLTPLIKFMDENEYHYFLVAGKDGTCSRYMKGSFDTISDILLDLMAKNKQFKNIIDFCSDYKKTFPEDPELVVNNKW